VVLHSGYVNDEIENLDFFFWLLTMVKNKISYFHHAVDLVGIFFCQGSKLCNL
jgi:hypothetical protein